MFSKVIIRNIQSHKYTEIEFKEGITSIIGESDQGKTGIFRAIDWARENKPSGNTLVSDWALEKMKNGKYKLIDVSSCTIIFSEGKYVTREKNQDGFNGYYIGSYDGEFHQEQEFATVGVSVPPQVTDLFHMDSVNVQSQYDSMFLLSKNGQDVARFFNKLVKLDISDTALSLAESKKRSTKKDKELIEEEISEIDIKLEKLQWVSPAMEIIERIEFLDSKIDAAEKQIWEVEELIENMEDISEKCKLPDYYAEAKDLITEIEDLNKEINQVDDSIYEISCMERDIQEAHDRVSNLEWIPEAEKLIFSIDKLNESISKENTDIEEINEIISGLKKSTSVNQDTQYISEAEKLISDIEGLNENIMTATDEIDDIDIMISKLKKASTKIKTLEEKVMVLENKLPDTCPLCGAPREKESA